MGQFKDTNFSHQNDRCAQCGSSNWQSLEMAYDQSVRQTEGGYRSVSKFGESIAPPEKRSLIGVPLWAAAALGSATYVASALIFDPSLEREWLAFPGLEAIPVAPAIVIAVVAFVVTFVAAARYNSTYWPAKYERWRGGRVCRRCGHRSHPTGKQSAVQAGSGR